MRIGSSANDIDKLSMSRKTNQQLKSFRLEDNST